MISRSLARVLAAASAAALAILAPGSAVANQAPAETIVEPAIEGIFAAFRSRPLVGLDHGHPRAGDLVLDLVRDPRFAREIGAVVLEGGSSLHQGTVDRYVNGEAVPYIELRAVAGDGIGPAVVGTFGSGMLRLLHQVRETNKALPPDGRIRVWLGEPPLDWGRASRNDVMVAMFNRDSNAAEVIIREILAKGRKALVYYGAFHLIAEGDWLRAQVETQYPRAFHAVLTYSFIHQPASCAPFVERAAGILPRPAIAMPARDGEQEPMLRSCTTLDGNDLVARGLLSLSGGDPPTIRADAIAFFAGGAADTSYELPLPDTYLDTAYRRELARRHALGGPILLPFPQELSFRRSDYTVDFDASGFAELVDRMFAEYDPNGDGLVTSDEYVDPVR